MTTLYELTNPQLDLLIAGSENVDTVIHDDSLCVRLITDYNFSGTPVYGYKKYNPTSNWSIAGPLIEREKLTVVPHGDKWIASSDEYENSTAFGDTYLEAAMRSYVAAKLGLEFDIPLELDTPRENSTRETTRPRS